MHVKVWCQLGDDQIRNLPKLGQGFCDFRSFNDVLKEASKSDAGVPRFAQAHVEDLRKLGHAKAVARHNIGQTYAQTQSHVDVRLEGCPAVCPSLLVVCNNTREFGRGQGHDSAMLAIPSY